MADNAFIKIGTALLKHQVKKLVGEETLGVLSEELADIGGDKLDAWLGDKSTIEELEKAAQIAHDCFHDSVGDHELEQWIVSLPIGDLPKVIEALAKLPTSPDEKQLENALRESVAGWRKISPEQINHAINSFLSCLRGALLPIEKQTLMVIGRSVLRIEEKINQLVKLVEQLNPYSAEKLSESRFGDVDINVGGDVRDSVIVAGINNVINYYATISTNIEKHEPDFWALKHPYPMPPNFTGRIAERAMLTHWLKEDSENRLFILRALGGFGKSALAWHWLTYDVDIKEFPKVLWWSFYEGDASFEHFLEETLKYLKLEVPQGTRNQVDELLRVMQSQKILLIMDGFERLLRAYSSMNASHQGDVGESYEDSDRDCVNDNAKHFLKSICSIPNVKSKALMTTRMTPRALEKFGQLIQGCREEELKSMHRDDAIAFLRRQGIQKGTNHQIEEVCKSYGFHPLSLRLLAGHVMSDFKNAGDILVAQKLRVYGDIRQHQNHILEVSYNGLPPQQQKLLSTIACFRASTKLAALESIAENREALENDLHDLMDRGVLQYDKKNIVFDLHPIVRRYAYERLTAPDRTAAHTRLHDYFANIMTPYQARTIQELTPVIELFHHCVQTGRYSEALSVFQDRLNDPLYVEGGEYILCVRLLESLSSIDEDKLFHGDLHAQSWLLNKLALCYNRTGKSLEAELTFKKQIAIRESMHYLPGVAIGLGNLSEVFIRTGRLKEATEALERKIDISKQIGDLMKEMVGRQDYGLVLAYRAEFEESEKQLKITIDWLSDKSSLHEETVSWTFYTLAKVLQGHINEALESAKRTNQLASQLASDKKRQRDVVRALWLLGAAYCVNRQTDLAEHHLGEALARDRAINLVEIEANILLDLARLRYDQTNYDEAKSLAEEALTITERCGYVLQGADVNLFLAQYALEQEKDKSKAKEYAQTALKLAHCDDGPPYYYKVAYDEAVVMLERLKV